MKLRPYQRQAISACHKSWEKFQRILLVLPTGAGKTITFSAITKNVVDRGHKVLIIAHREELLDQACDKLRESTLIEAEIEKASHHASREASVVVASVQSMQGERLRDWPSDHFHLVIVDEAHHVLADSYRNVIRRFELAKLLGVTATPDRSDKKGLGEVFDDIAFELSLADLINDGFLARPTVRTLPLSIDLQSVKSLHGDYQASGLGDAITPYLAEIVTKAEPHLTDRKTLVFCPLVETSQEFVRIANEAGLTARHVDSTSKDRSDLLAWFAKAGPGSMLSCAMLLTEGFDEPSADCVLNLRPTKSRGLYAQIVGRILRTHPGKDDALILDVLWQTGRLSLIKPSSLVTSSKVQAKAIEDLEDGDLLDIAERAEADRLAALKNALQKQRGKKSRLIDPIELAVMMNSLGLSEYQPTCRWHSEAITERQASALEKAGVDLDLVQDKGHASAILGVMAERREMGLATPKQVRLLVRFRHPRPHEVSFEAASQIIGSKLGKRRRRPARLS